MSERGRERKRERGKGRERRRIETYRNRGLQQSQDDIHTFQWPCHRSHYHTHHRATLQRQESRRGRWQGKRVGAGGEGREKDANAAYSRIMPIPYKQIHTHNQHQVQIILHECYCFNHFKWCPQKNSTVDKINNQ